MLQRTKVVLLSAAVLAGCSASGPTFNAYSLRLANGEQAYRVDCYGIFEGQGTCHKKAEEICGNQPVRALEDAAPLGSTSDGKPNTRILTFQCGVPSAPPPVVAPVPVPVPPPPPPPPAKVVLGGDANFDTAKWTLRPEARAKLDKLVSDASGATFALVTVKGYTDSRGSDAYNLNLSQHRAETVAAYLRDHGLQAQRYAAHGYGKADPVASNDTVEGRAKNRRVEIQLDQR